MDQHLQFYNTVQTVLAILMDETSDPADQVQRAKEILLRLPVPMPVAEDIYVLPDTELNNVLYVAGPDGLPTTIEYSPEPEDGLLTDEEVTIMRSEMREYNRCAA